MVLKTRKNKKPATTENTGKLSAKTVKKQRKTVVAKKESKKSRATGLTVDLFDVKGKVTGKLSLPKEIFGAKVNKKLMAQAVRVYLANQRQGTVSTKTRGEVRGSTRKLYRQKGTGRARAGSIRSPLRVGGGVVFGPKPRNFSLRLSKNMKRVALFSALASKLREKNIAVISGLEKIEPKTKEMVTVFKNMGFENGESTLLILPKNVDNIVLASRNIEGADVRLANQLSTYDVLSHKSLLTTPDAIAVMEGTWIK